MLTVTDLTIEYADGTKVIDMVRFSIAAGENVALVGANGAGKTSLLLGLVGVLPSAKGEIRIGETILHKKNLREIRSKVGLVFQNPDDQLFMSSIEEDIAFGPRNSGCCNEETVERVTEALTMLQIEHLATRSPLKLSGGEKRLAAIATVLAMRPDLLLFDEPVAFLDPRSQRNLCSILSKLPQSKLIATHDLTFAQETCSRVLLLKEGTLVANAGVELLLNRAELEAAGL